MPAPPPAAPGAAAVVPSVAQVLARIGGHSITQEQFDQLAGPYFARLRTDMGAGLTEGVMKSARQNVFDELVRREVLAIESERQSLPVTEQDTDALLRQDPSLQTAGRFDPAKLREYKSSPGSNYGELLPRLREMVVMRKLDQQLRDRFAASRAELQAEFEKRNARVRFKYLRLQTRDISLEPESTEPEWHAYHSAHPDEFVKRSQMRLRYRRLPLPAATDSTRASAESLTVQFARRMADSLRAGSLADSSAEMQDTGLFEVGGPSVPGLGRAPELTAGIAQADTVPSLRVLGPYRTEDALIVAVVTERQPKQPKPFLEALGEIRRRADAEKRKTTSEAERRVWFAARRERYRGTRAGLTRVTLRLASYKGRDIPEAELDRWYKAHGGTLFDLPDSSHAWRPPIGDSLRRVVRARLIEDERERWVAGTMQKLVAGLPTARDVAALARANGATAETLSLVRGAPADTLFPAMLVDSILTNPTALKGLVQPPRRFGTHSVVWRVDSADTAYLPPFELARARIEPDFQADKRRQDEQAGRAHYDQHRADYVTPVQYTIDYVAVPVASPDSVRIAEAELKAAYQKDLLKYRQEEQVHARHVLLSAHDGDADLDAKARARADSLLAAIRAGADFADVARRFSQDPGSAVSGGDLGWFGRGRMVPEFDRAAFALKTGEVSPVVKSQFGYHIVKLDERKAAGTRPFAEVRTELRAALASARADTAARRSAETLRRRLALAASSSAPAAPFGGVKSSPSFAANEQPAALGIVQGLSEDIAKLPAGRWAPKVYRSANSYVVLRRAQTTASRPAEFEAVKSRAVEDAKSARRKELLDQKVGAIRAALAAGAPLDSLAAPHGGLKDSGPVTPGFGFVPGLGAEPRLVQSAFAAKLGAVSDTLQVAQGVVWFRLEEHNSGDPKLFESTQAQLTQELAKQKSDLWFEAKRKALKLEILRPEFRAGPAIP
jgi:parvulin-like peptidyl-prolyl isomerase